MPLPSERFRDLIEQVADSYRLPPWGDVDAATWLEGLVMTESSGNPLAMRYEPHQDRAGRRDQATDLDQPGVDDGICEDDRSYGLCQVMGYNLRRLWGIDPVTPINFGRALEPLQSLDAGCRILTEELRATGGDVPRALARYNGGPTGERIGDDGRMRRQGYVDVVERWARRVRADRAAVERVS